MGRLAFHGEASVAKCDFDLGGAELEIGETRVGETLDFGVDVVDVKKIVGSGKDAERAGAETDDTKAAGGGWERVDGQGDAAIRPVVTCGPAGLGGVNELDAVSNAAVLKEEVVGVGFVAAMFINGKDPVKVAGFVNFFAAGVVGLNEQGCGEVS